MRVISTGHDDALPARSYNQMHFLLAVTSSLYLPITSTSQSSTGQIRALLLQVVPSRFGLELSRLPPTSFDTETCQSLTAWKYPIAAAGCPGPARCCRAFRDPHTARHEPVSQSLQAHSSFTLTIPIRDFICSATILRLGVKASA